MHFQDIDLDETSPWRHPKNTVEYHYRSYGEPFYSWIEGYTNTADPSVFDNHKDEMQVLYALKPHHNFFYRLAKIIYLYQEWIKYGCWKDPIIVRPMAWKDDKTLYIVNPGQDRWLVMKHFGVSSYNFLVLDMDEFDPEHQAELEAMWTKSTLEFRNANGKWTLINTHKKFNTTIVLQDWFALGSSTKIADPINPRDRALFNHKKRSF